MKFVHLEISNFRNLQQISIAPSPNINIFHGLNGSGKTSLLEVIHYLALGRSFRTRSIGRLINHNATGFSVFSQLLCPTGGMVPIGIAREKNCQTIKISGKVVTSLLELAKILPLQLINSASHSLLTLGPLVRRQFLDWGVFHVEPQFYGYWQRTNRLIKQRNALLKASCRYQDMELWDNELESYALMLDGFRERYVQQFQLLFKPMLAMLLGRNDFDLHYFPGWDTRYHLKELLRDHFLKERQLGYTLYGPQRADLQLKIGNIPAIDVMSQGQQKLSAYALRLTQSKLLQELTNKICIILIDDLPSELDREKRQLISTLLAGIESQMFITSITPDLDGLFAISNIKMFHVEHGKILLKQ